MIKRPLACPTTHIFLSPLPLWILHRQLDLNYLKVKFQASTCRDGHAWVGNNDVMFVRKLVSLQDVSNLVAIDACYKEKGPSCIKTTERLSLEGHVAPTFCPFPLSQQESGFGFGIGLCLSKHLVGFVFGQRLMFSLLFGHRAATRQDVEVWWHCRSCFEAL